MATLTGHLVADTYKALLKLIDNDILTASEKQISDGFGGGSNVFIDQNGFLRAAQFKVTGGTSAQFLKGNGLLDSTSYLPAGTTTSSIAEGSNLYFTTARVLATTLAGFVAISGTVTAADTVLSSIEKIWYNIINGGGGGGGGYVPYIGATQDLDLGTFGLIGDFLQFNTTNSAIPVGAGTMAFNNIDGTADIRLKGGNVNLPIGQQEVVRVVNVTGASLLGADYQAVYISGAVGEILQVDLALAVTGVTSAGTLGLVSETIADTLEGFITSSGLVREIDTTGDLQGEIWADGDILYLSPTVAGQITNVQPTAPDLTVIIGFVVYADAIDGKIFVKVNGNISGAGDINYVPKFDSANSIINSLIYDDGTDIGIATISPTFPADRSGLVIRANGVNSIEILLQSSINTDATIQGLAIANIFDEGGAIYQRANQHLRFGTNNLERMRLTEGGYLALGLTAPSSIIHAKDSTLYAKIIIDNNSLTGGGSFSASQDGAETAIFGVSGAWATNTTSDAAVVATRAGQGILFYTNGSTTAKGGINSVGDSFIGQLPAYYAGVTNFIVQGIAAGSLIGITHFDGTIKGIFSTLNSGVNIGSDTPHPVIFRADDIESARIASDGKWLFGTIVNDNVNIVQVNGSIIATSLKKSGGIATEFLKADGSVDSNTYYLASNPSNYIDLTALSSTALGLTYTNTTGVFSLTAGYMIPTSVQAGQWNTAYVNTISSATGPLSIASNVISIALATASISGYLSASDFNTFNNKENLLIFNSPLIRTVNTITISQASGSVNGYLSSTDWTTFNNKSNTNGTVTSVSGTGTVSGLTLTGNVTTTGSLTLGGTLSLTNGNVTSALGFTPVTNARTLTINGISFDLSADRSWTVSGTIGGLTTNKIPKATSASTLGDSIISESSTTITVAGSLISGGSNKFAKIGNEAGIFTNSTYFTDLVSLDATVLLSRSDGLYTGSIFTYESATAEILGIVSNGAIKMVVNGTANRGMTLGTNGGLSIGTTTASAANGLLVAGAATFSGDLIVNGTNKNIQLGSTSLPTTSDNLRHIFAGASAFIGQDGAGETNLGNNIYYNVGFKRRVTGYASNIRFNDGNIYLQTATTAAANSAITWTDAFSITLAGNVGIGTSSPSGISTYTTLDIRGATGGGIKIGVTGSSTPFNLQQAGTDAYLNNVASGSMYFYNGDALRMQITSAGGVNINTTTTGYTLNAIRSTSTQFNAAYKASGSLVQIMARFMGDTSSNLGIAIGYASATYGSTSGIWATQAGILFLGVLDGTTYKSKIRIDTTTVAIDIPTSSAGLASGQLWNDGGTVKITT